MKTAEKPLTTTKAPARRATAAQAIGIRAVTGRSTASKATGSAAKNQAGPVLTQGSYRMATTMPVRALKVTVEVDPLVDVVRRHVHLTPSLAKLIKGDFVRLFRNPALAPAPGTSKPKPAADTDPVLSTQDAADLVGVSRPYLVARIEAGDIPLHQQVGNQRRVLKSAVLAWHRREQARRRRALGHLGADLDSEIFAG
jgi:excisionase family DNA binding protein